MFKKCILDLKVVCMCDCVMWQTVSHLQGISCWSLGIWRRPPAPLTSASHWQSETQIMRYCTEPAPTNMYHDPLKHELAGWFVNLNPLNETLRPYCWPVAGWKFVLTVSFLLSRFRCPNATVNSANSPSQLTRPVSTTSASKPTPPSFPSLQERGWWDLQTQRGGK